MLLYHERLMLPSAVLKSHNLDFISARKLSMERKCVYVSVERTHVESRDDIRQTGEKLAGIDKIFIYPQLHGIVSCNTGRQTACLPACLEYLVGVRK